MPISRKEFRQGQALESGELPALVLRFLTDHPDLGYTPREITTELLGLGGTLLQFVSQEVEHKIEQVALALEAMLALGRVEKHTRLGTLGNRETYYIIKVPSQ